jgi:hypothetical protein
LSFFEREELRAELKFTSASAGVREFKLNFGDGEASGITTTNFTNSTNYGDSWYTVDGRKLDKQPTKVGLYIHGGNKFVIK